MSITWQSHCIELLRTLINDVDEENQLYTDSRLTKLLVVAGFQVIQEADFSQDFVSDIARQTISPDPTDTDSGTNDDNFVNLMCLKAACILSHGVAVLAANNATAGKDTVSSWDLKGPAQFAITLLKEGWCKKYEEALNDYLVGDGVVGAAIMGPFRTKSRGIYPY